MGNINIRKIKNGNPAIDLSGRVRRRYLGDDGVEYPGPEAPTKSSSFSWNNLVTQIGSSISSIFGGLTALKASQANADYQYTQQKQTNTMLWVGIAVVAVIVIGLIVFLRK